LRSGASEDIMAPMKVFAAIGVLSAFTVALSAGIVFALKGNPWLLIASLGLFVFLFVRVGCTEA
jgi:hypothetical protein